MTFMLMSGFKSVLRFYMKILELISSLYLHLISLLVHLANKQDQQRLYLFLSSVDYKFLHHLSFQSHMNLTIYVGNGLEMEIWLSG